MDTLGVKLLNAPFKDYTIVAKDGRSIQVHKNVLCVQSEYFNTILTDDPYDEYTDTNFEYDDLLIVMHWMYGLSVQLTHASYLIATQFEIEDILSLDWDTRSVTHPYLYWKTDVQYYLK